MTELEKKLSEAIELYSSTKDEEMRQMALEEIIKLRRSIDESEPINQGSAILEIRAGTGGDEAELFAGDLFRMYSRYADSRHWQVVILDQSSSDLKGIKSLTAFIKGHNVYGDLRYEGGVHRVQRVPKTEKSGRIHTSAASVVVLPQVKEIDVQINPSDLRIDVFRASGHGGQGVNTTDSAVRVTHLPTGIIVTCQDERSQLKNKDHALSVLRSRLWEIEQNKQIGEISTIRKDMIKTGDRSDKIRTYNFPQNRLTDHRIGKSWHNLEAIINGDLGNVIGSLKEYNYSIVR